jgi:hypothetical protein
VIVRQSAWCIPASAGFLHRAFRELAGTVPTAYERRLRMDHAPAGRSPWSQWGDPLP